MLFFCPCAVEERECESVLVGTWCLSRQGEASTEPHLLSRAGSWQVGAPGPQCPMLCLRDPTVRGMVTSERGLAVCPQSRGMVAWGPVLRWCRDPAAGRMVVPGPSAWVTVGPAGKRSWWPGDVSCGPDSKVRLWRGDSPVGGMGTMSQAESATGTHTWVI